MPAGGNRRTCIVACRRQVVFLCAKMDRGKQRDVIEQCRYHRRRGNPHIRNIRPRCQDERPGTHDWWHELPPGAGGRFDRGGKVRPEPRPLHHGNRETTRGHHVRHRAARQRPHYGTRDRRRLGRAALRPAGHLTGESNQEFTPTCRLQQRPEQHKQVHEIGRHTQRDTPNPFRAQIQMLDQTAEAISPVGQHAGQVRTEDSIGQRQQRYGHQTPSGGPPGQFQHHDDRQRSGHEVQRRGGPRAADQRLLLNHEIPAADYRPQQQQSGHCGGGGEESPHCRRTGFPSTQPCSTSP